MPTTPTTARRMLTTNLGDMKGIMIDHIIDHKVPAISQQFDQFYNKAAKIAAGKLNPDLNKIMWTLKAETEVYLEADMPEIKD
eukprot:jgi/Psemu1/33179/gm1.33179_g